MPKSKKDPILTSLTTLEKTNIEAKEDEDSTRPHTEEVLSPHTPLDNESIQASKPKKERTPAQIAVFEKARKNREANILKLREEAQRIAEEEKKLKEEKLIKKAVAVRKKQLKREQILDELSDDDTPVQKSRETSRETKVSPTTPCRETEVSPTTPSLPLRPVIKFF